MLLIHWVVNYPLGIIVHPLNEWGRGPVSRKSRELSGPKSQLSNLQSTCFEKLIFEHVFNVRKTKRMVMFDGVGPRRCEDIREIVATEIDPRSFGKRAPVL